MAVITIGLATDAVTAEAAEATTNWRRCMARFAKYNFLLSAPMLCCGILIFGHQC